MENLKVIYEDNHIIVVEKIPNIASQADKTGDIDKATRRINNVLQRDFSSDR